MLYNAKGNGGSWMKKGEDLRWMWLLALLAAIPCAWATGLRGWAQAAVYVALTIAWALGLVVLWVVSIWIAGLTVDLDEPVMEDHPGIRWIVMTIVGLLCRIGRLRITVKGWENVPGGPFLLVGNHRSNYDPIATLWAMRQRGVDVAFVTKPENMKLPLVPMIHRANFLTIDREDPRKAIATINAAAELLKNSVVNVGIYPEGTRSKGREMLPFHNAVFKIAQRAKVPIVVVCATGTEKIGANVPWRRTDVTLNFCQRIERDEVAASSTKQLGELVRQSLEQAAAQGDAS